MTPFPGQPTSVWLPSTSSLVEDPDEEIFLLYVRKQTTDPAVSRATGSAPPGGLGFLSSKQELLPIELKIVPPTGNSAGDDGLAVKRKGKSKAKAKAQEVVVCVEVQQSLEMLRNRKGDTGSVLWRPPVPTLRTSRVLELGSGTGFLGLALRDIVAHWTFTDQLASLPLVARNLDRNAVQGGDLQELDWLVEGAPGQTRRRAWGDGTVPDLIVAADCIYNPSLSAPLARTIDGLAGEGTVALVASELRDAEPLEEFLKEWVEGCGWTVVRVAGAGEGEEPGAGEADEIWGREYVVWVGWKDTGGAATD